MFNGLLFSYLEIVHVEYSSPHVRNKQGIGNTVLHMFRISEQEGTLGIINFSSN